MSNSFSITDKTKGTEFKKLSSVPFEKMKNVVLGKKYELSLVFVGETKSKELNVRFREKNKPTNVLSFPLNKNGGEIFICLSVAKKECIKFEKSFIDFVKFLFIHGMLHLKGMEHGSRMEGMEEKLLKQFLV